MPARAAIEGYTRRQRYARESPLDFLSVSDTPPKAHWISYPLSFEAYVRRADGLFVLHDMSEDETIKFRSVEIEMPIAAVFRGVIREGGSDVRQASVGRSPTPDA